MNDKEKYDILAFVQEIDKVETSISHPIERYLSVVNKFISNDFLLLMPYYFFDNKSSNSHEATNNNRMYRYLCNDNGIEAAIREHSKYNVGVENFISNDLNKTLILKLSKGSNEAIKADYTDLSNSLGKSTTEDYNNGVRLLIASNSNTKTPEAGRVDIKNIVDIDGDKNEEFIKMLASFEPFISGDHNVYFIYLPNAKGMSFGAGGVLVVKKGELTKTECEFFMTSSLLLINKFELSNKVHQSNIAASRAAISQVMARNMSHNIGSHVFPNLVDEGIGEKIEEKLKLETYHSDNKLIGHNNQISYFNQYLKNRMDYLSELTFGVANMLTTKKVYGEVFKEFDRVRLLLNFISGIDKFKYRLVFQHNGENLSDSNDISASFPSDTLGCQALYNIIENIIRNTAKHTIRNDDNEVVFTVNFRDDGEYYKVEIDNGIDNGINCEGGIDSLVESQNDKFDAAVIDAEDKLRNHSLGLLEMQTSATFLRQIDVSEMQRYGKESADKKKEIIRAIKIDEGGKHNVLGYCIYIKKPQEFLFVVDSHDEILKEIDKQRDELLNRGIWFKTNEDLMRDLKANISFPHRFILYAKYDKSGGMSQVHPYSAYKALLPIREVYDVDLNKLPFDRLDIFELESKIWELYNEQEGLTILEVKVDDIEKVDDKEDSIDKNKNAIILLDHLGELKEDYKKLATSIQEGNIENVWVEPLSSNGQNKLPYYNGLLADYSWNINENEFDNPHKPYIIKSMLLDCYRTRVYVIDERIKRYSQEKYKGTDDLLVDTIYSASNVQVTNQELEVNKFDEYIIDNITKELYEFGNGRYFFLLVHYGILERMFKTDPEQRIKKINKILEEWSKISYVVVTSGRGRHTLKLPNMVRYVNLSSVLYAFVENHNKYSINYILNQSRR